VGIRLRCALAAMAVMAVALLAGAAVMLVFLHNSLIDSADATALSRARDVSASATLEGPDDPDAPFAHDESEATLVQIIAPDGEVLLASPAAQGMAPFTSLRPGPSEVLFDPRLHQMGPPEQAPYRVLALGVDEDCYCGRTVVAVAQSMRHVEESVATVARLLAFGSPLLLLLVGAATYFFVGQSRRPVEAMRRRAASINARDLSQRVPVPPVRDEVARLAETLNGMLERLEAAQRSQRRFVADASHELRSPLATLKAGLDVVAAHPDPGLWSRTVADLRTESERLERLVNDLLLLASVDEWGLTVVRGDVDVDDLVYAEARRLRATTSLDVRVDVAPARVLGDVRALGHALRNLSDNAARHARGQVRLGLRREHGAVVVEVADDGPGIPARDRQRVFERFVRLDESRARGDGGSGLGLAILDEVVTAHGGTVTVDESWAGGARFAVRLPAAPQSPGSPVRPPARAAVEGG
jgi:signal transduction histidine kinase